MKTEPSTSSTTPPVLPKRGEPEINPPPSVRGNLAWGVHWPWHKALAVANRIWWYNPLRHTTTEKYTSENTFGRCHSSVGYLAKWWCCMPSDRGPDYVILPFVNFKFVGTSASTAKMIGDIPDFNVLNVPKTQPRQNPVSITLAI